MPRISPSTLASAQTSTAPGTSAQAPAGAWTSSASSRCRCSTAHGSKASHLTPPGYIPVDEYGRVIGVDAVYAAGDATDHPIKQGDLACQQADAVAAHVAAIAGAPVEAVAYAPVLRGRLLTGHSDRFLRRAEKVGTGEVAANPLWWPPKTVSGRYLAPYLEAQGVVDPPLHDETRGAGVDVRLSRSAGWSAAQSVTSTR